MQSKFLKITIYSLIFHIIAVIFSTGFHHFDEHFQIYEFLNYKLGLSDKIDLPWEFKTQIRPWFQVSIYYLIQKFFGLIFNINSPFIFATIFRLFTSLFAVYSVFRLIPILKIWFQKEAHQVMAYSLLNFLWFIPYIHTRTNGESLSLSFFLIGVSFFIKSKKPQTIGSYFLAGIFFGVAYLSRSQIALSVAALWFWAIFIGKYKTKYLSSTALAIIFIILIGIPIDYWGYGEWTFSTWNYFEANFIKGMMKSFGVSPWWDYFRLSILRGIPPVSIPLILATLYGWYKYKTHPLTWITLPFVLFHSYLGHKELRFIFSVACISPLYLSLIYQDHYFYWSNLYKNNKAIRYLAKFLIGINCTLLLISILRPANPSVNFYKYIYDHDEIKKFYIIGENPFTMLGLKINYYKRKNLLVEKITNYNDQMNKIKSGYFFFNKGKYIFELENKSNCKNIFMSYPRFVLDYNIGNWLSRSRVWSLYHCTN